MAEKSEPLRPPLYSLLGFTCGVVETAVALQIEGATRVEELRANEGRVTAYALTPQAAIDLGRALIERGELLLRPADVKAN